MNATRTAKAKMAELEIDELEIRDRLGLDPDARIGAKEVTDAADLRTAQEADEATVATEELETVDFTGADVDAALDADDSYAAGHEPNWGVLDFPVSLKPLEAKVNGKRVEIPDRRSIWREDRDLSLNIVSDRYRLVTHRQIFEPMAQAVEALEVPVRAVRTETGLDGAYARVQWILGNPMAVGDPDDEVMLVLTGHNSYNYEAPLGIELGAWRKVCTNGLMAPVGTVLSHKRRHMTHVSVPWFLEKAKRLVEQGPVMVEAWAAWSELDLKPETFEAWLKRQGEVIGKKARGQILEYYGSRSRQSLWEAYNSVTWYATHRIQSRNEDRRVVTEDLLQRTARRIGSLAK